MPNKRLFGPESRAPAADTTNKAGGRAYSMPPEEVLARLACTGTLHDIYYADAKTQLDEVISAASLCDPEFVAKAAIYARHKGFMKDMPAVLLVHLSTRDTTQTHEQGFEFHPEGARHCFLRAFSRVIDNGRMLRGFVQIMQSGAVGRKSLGSMAKKAVRKWLESRSPDQLFRDSVGKDPSLVDCIKLAHPRFEEFTNQAARHIMGLPAELAVKSLAGKFDMFKASLTARAGSHTRDAENIPQGVPMQMLTALPLTKDHWKQIALTGGLHQTRMNLNSYAKHAVFEDDDHTTDLIAEFIDSRDVVKDKLFPYQAYTSYAMVNDQVPNEIKAALFRLVERSLVNAPQLRGNAWVVIDVSGSMGSPLTGFRKGATTIVRCVDVAALIGAAVIKTSPSAKLIAFDTEVHENFNVMPDDSIRHIAQKLATYGGGGTNMGAAMEHISNHGGADFILVVSDNESWMDLNHWHDEGTASQVSWERIKAKSPRARMACINLQPYTTSQVQDDKALLRLGGFSDALFELVAVHAKEGVSGDYWVKQIASIDL
jgi:60 kDa SS-A/Ro ribonucleoprotein